MIRAMVVEDEPPIAQSIKRLAEEFDGGGVKVVHIAINGQRALDYLEDNDVDLIFSDIKMPVMDGIELARRLSESNLNIRMVIISGFQEFEFARSAIRYGVENYLLKPVSRGAIHEVLRSVSEEINRQGEASKRKMLEKAIANKDAVINSPEGEICGIALMCAGAYPLVPDELMPGRRDVLDSEAIEAFVSGLLSPGGTCICLDGKSLAEKAVVFSAVDAVHVTGTTRKLFNYLSGRSPIAITIAVYEHPAPIGQVGSIFSRLRKKLYKEMRLFSPQILFSGEAPPEDGAETAEFGTELIQALKSRDEDSIRLAAAILIETLAARKIRQHELLVQLERLLMNFFDSELSIQQLGELKLEIQGAITTALTADELAGELSEVLLFWLGADNQMEKVQLQNLCEEIAAYIRVHHQENITTDALGRHFGFAATQLAKKFKGHFGISISEYVNSYRIELAQALMRNNKRRMIKEVALEVGYNDQYYFSKTFKKITGIWPTEYIQEDGYAAQ